MLLNVSLLSETESIKLCTLPHKFLRLLYTLNKPGLRDIVLDICIHEFHDSFRLPLNQNPVE